MLLLGGGVLGLFLGMALLAPRLVTPLARLVGWPARRAGGVAGELAGANAVRNPGRTASTAAALMIGLTLVTLVAVLASSLSTPARSALKKDVHAAYVIDGKDGMPFRAAEGDQLERIAGVTSASHVRSDTVIVDGKERPITGIDPATIAHFYQFRWSKGSEQSLGQLGTDGAIVTKDYAKAQHLTIGELAHDHDALGRQAQARRARHPRPQDGAAGRRQHHPEGVRRGLPPAEEQPHVPRRGRGCRQGDQVDGQRLRRRHVPHGRRLRRRTPTKDMAKMLAMLYVLLGFSVIVSLFGMVNTLVLSVFERTREIGMLRTIGMTRRQARRMIRHESIITALIGAALGLGLGTALAAMVMAKCHLPIAIPVHDAVRFTLIAVLAGIGAAVMPARRASRLNVLEALQYE